jgi:alpha-aminoadipic semialdehyde synthase
LVTVTPKSEAEMIELPWDYCGGNFTRTLHDWDTRTTEKDSAGGVFLSPGVNASVREDSSNSESEDVLVLGAGLVASPAIEYLARKPGRTVTVVSGVPGEATRLKNSLGNPPNVVPLTLDVVGQADDIRTNIERSSAVLSLLPATMHVPIIQHCIHAGVPAITASYVNEEMQALDAAARAAGVPVLNEMGLDPGMDHMSAMKVIHEVQSNGGKISSFSSLCGGLPAPEAANNPLMYKFSWSPLGVLRAAQNSSQYLNNNKIIQVDGSNLLSSAQQTGCKLFLVTIVVICYSLFVIFITLLMLVIFFVFLFF